MKQKHELNEEQCKILGSLSEENLFLIKEEGETYLDKQAESENIIIAKATNLFQLLVAILISLMGYLISEKDSLSNVPLYYASVIFEISIAISTIFSFVVIFPKTIFLRGTPPRNVLQLDIFNGSEYDKLKFLKNRILSIDCSIEKNKKSHSTRILYYKLSIITIFLGIVCSTIVFV